MSPTADSGLTPQAPGGEPRVRRLSSWLMGAGAVAVAAIAVLVSHLIAGSFGPREDAFITYTYARNLAQGHGWVFFPGEPATYGSTTPLFVLLLAGAHALGADIPAAGHVLHLAGTGTTVLLIFLLCRRMGSPLGGLLGGLLFGLHGQIPYLISGMETSLVLALSAALVLLSLRRHVLAAGIVSGILVLIRPDAVLLPALLFFHLLATRRCEVWKALLPAFVVVLPWCLYAWRTFGTIVPNSVVAKELAGTRVYSLLSWSSFVHHFLPYPWTPLIAVAAVLAAIGAASLWRKDSAWLAVLAWPPLYFLAMRLGAAPSFGVYYVPPLLVVWLAVGCGLAQLPRLASSSRVWRAAGAGLALALMAFLVFTLVRGSAATMKEMQEPNHKVVSRLAAWLAANAPAGSRVCSFEVGHLGYFSGCNVLDLLGLTTRRTWPWLKAGEFGEAVEALKPDYVVVLDAPGWIPAERVLHRDWFKRNYREVYSLPYWRRLQVAKGRVAEGRAEMPKEELRWRRESYGIYRHRSYGPAPAA